MRNYSVRLLPVAEEDLNDILSYIAADHLAAASRVADRIENSLHRLVSHPLLGRVPHDEKLAAMGYRFLVVENYLIFHTITGHTILIHRILYHDAVDRVGHGARDIQHLL